MCHFGIAQGSAEGAKLGFGVYACLGLERLGGVLAFERPGVRRLVVSCGHGRARTLYGNVLACAATEQYVANRFGAPCDGVEAAIDGCPDEAEGVKELGDVALRCGTHHARRDTGMQVMCKIQALVAQVATAVSRSEKGKTRFDVALDYENARAFVSGDDGSGKPRGSAADDGDVVDAGGHKRAFQSS